MGDRAAGYCGSDLGSTTVAQASVLKKSACGVHDLFNSTADGACSGIRFGNFNLAENMGEEGEATGSGISDQSMPFLNSFGRS